MQSQLNYNRQKLERIRDHSEKHPDAVEKRKKTEFRRIQYGCLLFAFFCMAFALFFVEFNKALIFAPIMTMIVAGVLFNGRERDADLSVLSKIMEHIIREKK